MAASQGQITRFMRAAQIGNLSLLKELATELDNGEGLSSTLTRLKDDKGRTALHFAAAGGNKHICYYLIKYIKLDVNIRDDNGNTPLHVAVQFDRLPTTIFLIKNGASVKLSASDGFTPLHYAAEKGNIQILRLLITEGAEIDAVSSSGTPLEYAACKGKRESVEVLLNSGADPNKVSCNFTPLVSSIVMASDKCVELLLKAGADPNLQACGVSPLGYAASETGGMLKIIQLLLKAGADPNAIDNTRFTPLELAASSGNHESVRILFPLTSRIQSFPEWSVRGIIKHMNSQEAGPEIEIKRKETFRLTKSKGEEAFKKKDYDNATFWYTQAQSLSPDDATLHSNLSLCWAHLNKGDLALSEAQACARLRPKWSKAHYRIGSAWKVLGNYSEAAEAFSEALKLDPDNKEIEKRTMKF